MTKDNLRLPPGVTLRPISRLDIWRFSERAILPRTYTGFVAERDGKPIAAAMCALGFPALDCETVWWVAVWFFDDTARRHTACVYRAALMWLAGLKVAGIGPLWAIPDPGVSEPWFNHLGFDRTGKTLEGREVYAWGR